MPIDSHLEDLKKKTLRIDQFLRSACQRGFKERRRVYSRPFGGSSKDSLGPWPEFIFRGFECPRSRSGFCTPCGYSNVPSPKLVHRYLRPVYESLVAQTDFILRRFNQIVMANQRRRQPYPGFVRRYGEGREAMFGLAPTGSFFNDLEIPHPYRVKILDRIARYAKQHRIDLQLFLEASAWDIIRANSTGTLQELVPMLQELNTVVPMGLESVDCLVRNVLYCKGLSLEEFESAVRIIRKLELVPAAFVFAGVHSLTQSETIKDLESTLTYLRRLDTVPVLMISNLKSFTLAHLLYTIGRYRLLEPRTILALVQHLTELTSKRLRTEPWLMADPVGGPPKPVANPFTNPSMVTCKKCTYQVLYTVRRLREDYDLTSFHRRLESLKRCPCAHKYGRTVVAEQELAGKTTAIQRATRNIEFADCTKEEYVACLLNLKS
jgi:radical SAM enzyme (TIGR01210 family)